MCMGPPSGEVVAFAAFSDTGSGNVPQNEIVHTATRSNILGEKQELFCCRFKESTSRAVETDSKHRSFAVENYKQLHGPLRRIMLASRPILFCSPLNKRDSVRPCACLTNQRQQHKNNTTSEEDARRSNLEEIDRYSKIDQGEPLSADMHRQNPSKTTAPTRSLRCTSPASAGQPIGGGTSRSCRRFVSVALTSNDETFDRGSVNAT